MSYKKSPIYQLLLGSYVDPLLNEDEAKKIFELEEDEEDMDVLYEKMKKIMSIRHPILTKKENEEGYKDNLKWMIELKSIFLKLAGKMVFDNYIGRKIRQLTRLNKEINEENLNVVKKDDVYLFEKGSHSELIEKMDKNTDFYQNTERYILRNFTPKEQMDYLTDMYTHSTKENLVIQQKEIELNNFYELGKEAMFDEEANLKFVQKEGIYKQMFESVSCNQFLNDPYYQHKINKSISETNTEYNPEVQIINDIPKNSSLDSYFQVQDLSSVTKKEKTYEELLKEREEGFPNLT
jgi:hypothetical protein